MSTDANPFAVKGKRLTSIPSIFLLLFAALGGVILGSFLAWDDIIPGEPHIELLPSPPSQPNLILGIQTFPFHTATLLLQTANDEIYSWSWVGNEFGWKLYTFEEFTLNDEPCLSATELLIRKSAGEIEACRAAQTLGEGCPGPFVSYVISAEGEIWRVEEQQFCPGFVSFWLILTAALGLVFGFILIIARKILLSIRK